MRSRIKHLASCFLALGVMAFVATLASCNKDEAIDDRLPDGKYPITFTTTTEELTVEKAATRATTDGTWDGDEEVAVKIGSEVKKYQAAADGTLTAAIGVTPWYWQSNTENKTVSAWYPYSEALPTSFTVQADQHYISGSKKSDMIYACQQEITYRSNKLTFRHLPAKVVVNLKDGSYVSPSDLSNATVSIVNQNLTSGTINIDGSVAQQTIPGSDTIAPLGLYDTPIGYKTAVQALLVPQKSTESTKFIKVTIGPQDFYYSTTLDLVAGKKYTYNITVLSTKMYVTESEVSEWTGTTTDVESREVAPGFAPTDLKVGDYYYSDGTTSDGGYRHYTDGTNRSLPIMPILINKRTVIGIVLKVGRDTVGAWKDDCQYYKKDGTTPMSAVRGYALALYDANGGALHKWGSYGTSAGTNTEQYAGFCGYKNTNIIKTFAENNSLTLKDDFPATYYATVDYESKYAAPTNSSGWFLPSAGQGMYWKNYQGGILESVKKATGNSGFYWKAGYWSSSENALNPTENAWCIYPAMDITDKQKLESHYIQSVLAF